MNVIEIKTNKKIKWIDISSQIQGLISSSNTREGMALVYVPHTTAAVTINEHADPAVAKDINQRLNQLAPEDGNYLHSEGNSDGHIKAALIGTSVNVPISGGQLQLGTWQGIFFCEFDGPRQRKVFVKIIEG